VLRPIWLATFRYSLISFGDAFTTSAISLAAVLDAYAMPQVIPARIYRKSSLQFRLKHIIITNVICNKLALEKTHHFLGCQDEVPHLGC